MTNRLNIDTRTTDFSIDGSAISTIIYGVTSTTMVYNITM